MAHTISVLPELVTSTDAVNHELTIDDALFEGVSEPILLIEVVSGTFGFAVGQTAANSSASYTDGDKFSQSIRKGFKLNFIAGAAAQSFKISAI